jgi:ABC-type spermidine/putrescine transport system permease subunit II
MTLERIERASVVGLALIGIVFLMLPIVIVIPMSFSSAQSLMFPPPGYSLRWYHAFFGDSSWMAALWNSLIVATASTLLAVVVGTLAAYGLVRGRFVGRGLIETNFMAPLILPSIITAIALYITFARVGLLGTYAGLIIAHTLHNVPYVVVLMSVAISSFDERLEQIARTLGGNERTIFLRILAPNLAPSILASSILVFTVSFDEVILTLFLFGTRFTVPKQMINRLELQIDPTITAVATLLILFTLAALACVAFLTRRSGLLLRRG